MRRSASRYLNQLHVPRAVYSRSSGDGMGAPFRAAPDERAACATLHVPAGLLSERGIRARLGMLRRAAGEPRGRGSRRL
ncbi:hypothetical protein A0H81_01718 [Grifola frondosa]|uniref:Uncharacterized protein n=1 Tax=Grifola frondosa TaxID=5627 RepID=A0A1C7MMS7_GRIFR|nr:hypothetical protein A0H81_01718 [Grifola frondosa]